MRDWEAALPRSATKDDGIPFNLAGKIVLLSGFLVSSYAMSGLTSVLPAIANHFSADPNAAMLTRMMVSVVGISMAISAPVMGAIADRFGARRVLLIALIAYAIAGCAPLLLDNLRVIVAFRAILGLAAAAIGALILVILVTRTTATQRDRWIGYLSTAATVAALFYGPVVGYIGHLGWQWPFATYGVALLIFVAVILGIEPDPSSSAKAEKARGPNTASSVHKTFVLGTPPLFILLAVTVGALLVCPALYIPFHMRDIGITDPGMIGILMMPTSLMGAVASMCFGWARSKLSVSALFVVAFVLMAFGIVTTGLSREIVQLVSGQLITGIGVGLIAPNIYGLGAVVGPDAYRARTIGFTKGGIFGGAMIGQSVLEPIAVRTNTQVVLCVIGLVSLVLGMIYAWRLLSEVRAVQQA